MSAVPAAASSADAPALTAPQLKDQLWAAAARHVVAVVMGSRVPGLPARLATADVIDFDCLIPGALSAEQQQQAPYMVHLASQSEFTDWLLFEAAAGLGDWGVLVLTTAPALALRSHLRSLMQAQLPDGQVIDLDWMDAPILQAVLGAAGAPQLTEFMGPLQSIVVPQAEGWMLARLALNQLQWQSIRLQRPS